MFSAEGNIRSAQGNSTVNTISFAVPIAYPINEKLYNDYKEKHKHVEEDLSGITY